MKKKDKYILWFREINPEDNQLIGQKGIGLAEMMEAGFPMPNGFCVTSFAYSQFLKNAVLIPKIKALLQGLDPRDPRSLGACSQKVKRLIDSSKIPEEIGQAMMKNYLRLGRFLREPLVAVRSSPTDEALNVASFLNIKGEANVVESVKKCWASLFTPENLLKRKNLLEEKMAVLVQRMIQSRVSGVAYSIDPEDKKKILIKAIYGLGELAVKGKVIPDQYRVDKDTFEILQKEINRQPVLTDPEIIRLARLVKKIQRYYFFPQEVEWAMEKRKAYVLQTRPMIKTKSKRQKAKVQSKMKNLEVLIQGKPASPGITSGYTRVIKTPKEVSKVKKGEVLISKTIDSNFLSAVRKIAGLVLEEENFLSYGAMISRELGIPCVVGAEKATKIIKTGMVITINGKTGMVFKGGRKGMAKYLVYKEKGEITPKRRIPEEGLKTATKVYVTLNSTLIAKELSSGVDGALFQPELIVTKIGIHPKKLIADKKEKVFMGELTEELEQICQTFNPKPVIYKALDFTTDEYRGLVNGKAYEPKEVNPLLGFHGCTRDAADPGIFELELKAIKTIRKRGLRNLSLMIPFVRTVREFRAIKKIIVAHGLIRTSVFALWLMLEIPSNIFLLEDFIKTGIDGVCLKIPDLLNFTLAIDRENKEVLSKFSSSEFIIEEIFKKILKTSHKYKILSAICTQEKFLYSDLIELLVKSGINAIFVNPSAAGQTREILTETEKRVISG